MIPVKCKQRANHGAVRINKAKNRLLSLKYLILIEGKLQVDQEVSDYLQIMIPDTSIVGHDPIATIFSRSNLSADQLAMITTVFEKMMMS
jgi:hypothetical protein